MAKMLSRAKSKDHLLPLNNNVREKYIQSRFYMLIAGAQKVL